MSKDVKGIDRADTMENEIFEQAVAARASGKMLHFICARYAYQGNVIKTGKGFFVLDGAKMPFETGALADAKYASVEDLPSGRWTVSCDAVESFGVMK